MPGSTVTVITASGERSEFTADDWSEDDNGALTLLNGSQKVARFAPNMWQGVYLPERGQEDRVITEAGS